MMDNNRLKEFIVDDSCTLHEAMILISKNILGLIFVVDNEKVIGVVSDGDIRRFLLKSNNINSSVINCMTGNFSYVVEGYQREEIIKLLDYKIHSIPVLDSLGRLVDIVNKGYSHKNRQLISRAKTPARISLAGGGTDFTKHFMDEGGAGLSCTIAKYSHAVLRKRSDQKIMIYSHDFKQHVELKSINDIQYDGKLDLIKAGIKLLEPEYGFDLEIGCDFPPESGLGGSASLLASVIGCLNEFREHRLDRYEIAEYAFEAERIELEISGGWQDQYSTVFGGFNYLEFDRNHNVVMPLRVESNIIKELEERLILCHTKQKHLGATIQNDNEKHNSKRLKNITKEMKRALLRSRYEEFAILLEETWSIKKENDPRVTNEKINKIHSVALDAGSLGGRLLGTGGGGYFLFYVPPFHRYFVIEALEKIGLKPEGILIDHKGLSSWRV